MGKGGVGCGGAGEDRYNQGHLYAKHSSTSAQPIFETFADFEAFKACIVFQHFEETWICFKTS